MTHQALRRPAVSRAVGICLAVGCLAFTLQPPSAQAGPPRRAATVLAPATPGVPTETLAQFLARTSGRLPAATRSSVDAADAWCYVYSTGIGLYWAPAGVASGALCLFVKDRKIPTAYTCYVRAPVNHGYGFVAAYGARSVNRRGRCAQGEWGYNRTKHSWAKFRK